MRESLVTAADPGVAARNRNMMSANNNIDFILTAGFNMGTVTFLRPGAVVAVCGGGGEVSRMCSLRM